MSRSMSLTLVIVLAGLVAGHAERSMEITGQVLDDKIQRVEGADVAIYELHGDDYYSPRKAKLLHPIIKTDHEGSFVFRVSAEPHCDIYAVARKEGLALGWDYLHREDRFFGRVNNKLCTILAKPYGLTGRLVNSEGEAVEGARVQVFIVKGRGGGFIYEPTEWFSVQTDAAGDFAFDNLPIDLTVTLHVEVPSCDITYIFPPQLFKGNACGGYYVDGDDIVLQLPPISTVHGQLIDRPTNRGVAGRELMLRPSESPDVEWRFRPCAIRTDTNGRFEIHGTPPGKHILRLVSPKTAPSIYVGKNVPIAVKQGMPIQTEVFVEKGIPLNIVVRDKETCAMLPDMHVFVDDRRHDEQDDVFIQETRTDATGVAHLFVPEGVFSICALGGNYNDVRNMEKVRVHITGPRTAPVEVFAKTLLPLVRGTVVDAQGRRAENVTITVGLGQRALTNQHGRFEGRQSPLYPSHLVVAQDARRDLAQATFFYDAHRQFRLKLKPGSSIRGRVTDEMGSGIAGARVSLALNCKRRGGVRDVHGTAHLPEIRADAQGYYQLDTLVPLRKSFSYLLSIQAPCFGGARHSLTEEMEPGEVVNLPDTKLRRTDAFITGIVVDQQGNPVPNKPVFAHTALGMSTHESTSTDEQGRFKFNRVLEGPVALQVGFGQGPDAAFVHAHTGDHVTVRLGDHFKDYISPLSLVGHALPDLASLEMAFDPGRIKSKKTLICFVDYTQSSSQNAIRSLNKWRLEFTRRNVEIVCIQVVPVAEGTLRAWRRQNRIGIPIDILPGGSWWQDRNQASTLKVSDKGKSILEQEWGVRSLPWTLLADKNGKIMATGFEIARIYMLVPEKAPSPRNPSRIRTRR